MCGRRHTRDRPRTAGGGGRERERQRETERERAAPHWQETRSQSSGNTDRTEEEVDCFSDAAAELTVPGAAAGRGAAQRSR